MRFKKGSKVEVFSKSEVTSGSWRCGEIISGNGHNYDIRYDFALDGAPIVERVSRKAIRPCPPPMDDIKDWAPGDLVEVFDNVSWKVAVVLKVMGGDYFFVRLVGSLQEFEIHKSELRVRQSWKNDGWVMVGKGPRTYEEGRSNKLSTSRHQKLGCHSRGTGGKRNLRFEDNYFCAENKNIAFQESHMVSSRTLKRGSPTDSHVEACTRTGGWKMRAIEKDGLRQRMALEHPSPLPEKVDAVASPRYMLGEKYMHASFYNKIGISEMDTVRAIPNGDDGCFNVRSLESSDAKTSESSVGSCSSTSNNLRLFSRSLTSPGHDPNNDCSDAESCCGGGYEKECPSPPTTPSKKDLAAEVHRIELHAYRCTMEALYASGPLSWEQEELVTNLRLTLHISNDEHLRELRNLISAETNLIVS